VDAAKAAFGRANAVQEVLAARDIRVSVIPVLVWWTGGDASERSREPKQFGKAYVLPGTKLATWISDRHENDPAVEEVAGVHDALAEHVTRQEDPTSSRPIESYRTILTPFVAALVTAVVAFFATLELEVLLPSWSGFAAGALAALALGVLARGWRNARYPALGWVAGVLVGAALVGASAIA
jgi:hypothetical protein